MDTWEGSLDVFANLPKDCTITDLEVTTSGRGLIATSHNRKFIVNKDGKVFEILQEK